VKKFPKEISKPWVSGKTYSEPQRGGLFVAQGGEIPNGNFGTLGEEGRLNHRMKNFRRGISNSQFVKTHFLISLFF
jgi:hypothetical protein